MRIRNAFTLVELLVVISIIALLLAILMPSLNKARNQARILTCQANAKQLGLIVQIYRADNKDCVPVMLNRWMSGVPTKEVLLSVALRAQITRTPLPSTPNLNPDDPSVFWANNTQKMNLYLKKYMPSFFACPFVRGKPAGQYTATGKTIKLGNQSFTEFKITGNLDCWTTPLWSSLHRTSSGVSVDSSGAFVGSKGFQYLNHPFGPPKGSLKYAMLSWYAPATQQAQQDPRFWLNVSPTKWSSDEMKALRASGPSDCVITYCCVGETYDYGGNPWSIMNYNSHMKGKVGGTTALFADGHIEWVEGSMIGWN